jgi:hypothetical protein
MYESRKTLRKVASSDTAGPYVMTTTTSLPAVVEMGTVMLGEVVPGFLLTALTNEIAARAGAERSAVQ